MDWSKILIVSPYLIAIGVAWLVAHFIKYSTNLYKYRRANMLRQMFLSGGMPSSHAATAVAVWMVVLLQDGADSGLFGLATLVALIICYDAVKVRRSVGEQGMALREVIEQSKLDVDLPRAARGHTPIEVIAGALLGILVGVVVYIAT